MIDCCSVVKYSVHKLCIYRGFARVRINIVVCVLLGKQAFPVTSLWYGNTE